MRWDRHLRAYGPIGAHGQESERRHVEKLRLESSLQHPGDEDLREIGEEAHIAWERVGNCKTVKPDRIQVPQLRHEGSICDVDDVD